MDSAETFSRLCLAARQSGAVAKLFQGKVQNDQKDLDSRGQTESSHVQAMQMAKTVIDESVQEIILLAANDAMDATHTMVDGEENTASLALFPHTDANTTVIIDPIDGTLEYLNGVDSYSVCIGIIEDSSIRMAVVFFPARNTAYMLVPDGSAHVSTDFFENGVAHASPIRLPSSPERSVYKTRRVPQDIEEKFTAAGFPVIGVDSYADALLKVLSGEAAGFIGCEPQMRDVLLGPIIGASQGGFMCDWRGEIVVWPKKGRITQSFFGNTAFEKEFRAILK